MWNSGQDVLSCSFLAKVLKKVLPCIYNIGLDFISCFLHAFRRTLCSIEKIKGSVCLKKNLMKCLTELLCILETSCSGCHSNNKPSIKAIFYMYCLYYNMLLGELQFCASVLLKDFSSFVYLNYPRNLCYRNIKHVNLVYHIDCGVLHAGHHFM